MGQTTILGAGGAIGGELARLLIAAGERPRLVSRSVASVEGAEVISAI